MSDLTTQRDHFRAMAASEHADGCRRLRNEHTPGRLKLLSCSDRECDHDPHEWLSHGRYAFHCPGICGGCMTDSERALWQRLADEVEDYLDRGDDVALEGL